ncbi:hypothetical protein ACU4GD_21620 [Cupriavidus basilensis]
MTNSTSGTGVTASAFLLKTSPPRGPRHLLARRRLRSDCEHFADRPVTIAQAPAGFGKTSLLIQWHRECIMRGSAAAWVSLDEHDDPGRLLTGLTSAIRPGCAAAGIRQAAAGRGGIVPRVAGRLYRMAGGDCPCSAADIVLILDEAERLPESSRDALIYLLNNLPPNLRIVVAAWSGFDTAHRAAGPL